MCINQHIPLWVIFLSLCQPTLPKVLNATQRQLKLVNMQPKKIEAKIDDKTYTLEAYSVSSYMILMLQAQMQQTDTSTASAHCDDVQP